MKCPRHRVELNELFIWDHQPDAAHGSFHVTIMMASGMRVSGHPCFHFFSLVYVLYTKWESGWTEGWTA